MLLRFRVLNSEIDSFLNFKALNVIPFRTKSGNYNSYMKKNIGYYCIMSSSKECKYNAQTDRSVKWQTYLFFQRHYTKYNECYVFACSQVYKPNTGKKHKSQKALYSHLEWKQYSWLFFTFEWQFDCSNVEISNIVRSIHSEVEHVLTTFKNINCLQLS